MGNLATIKKQALDEIARAQDLVGLEGVWKKYLGPFGSVKKMLKELKTAPQQERASRGRVIHEVFSELEGAFRKRSLALKGRSHREQISKEWIDVTLPGKRISRGHLHPLTQVRRKAEDIFRSLGFSVIGGPEVETEHYNFDALNIPQDHPARDLWDTLWLQSNQKIPSTKYQITNKPQAPNLKPQNRRGRLLLRTHTSPVQIRYMEMHEPPFQIIVPGRVFRYEASDASHDIQFYQVEGLMVGEDVNVANFKAVIETFFQQLFKKSIHVRLRPSYFPFVEPGFEVDMTCIVCGEIGKALRQAQGCSVCAGTGWLEMMGAGMVHPNVFKAVRYNPKLWHGFAFGMGLDRIAMMKYKINDIRLFHQGDLRFLRQF